MRSNYACWAPCTPSPNCWINSQAGQPVGSIALARSGEAGVAKLRLLLVGEAARGHEVTQAAGLLLVRSYPDDGDTLDCLVADNRTGKVLAQLSLAECDSARGRVDDGHLLLFDQAGRLIDVYCEDGAVHVLTLG